MPGRKYAAGSGYRYGFNGKEQDKDISSLTIYDYGFRIYNSAIGRFLSVDPLSKEYPWNSPYSYAEGDVIRSIDLDGLEKLIVIIDKDRYGRVSSMTFKGVRSIDVKDAVDANLKFANKSDVTRRDVLIIKKQEGQKDLLSYSDLNDGYRKKIRDASKDNNLVNDESMKIPEGAKSAVATDEKYNGQLLKGEASYDQAKFELFKSIQRFSLIAPKELPFQGEFERVPSMDYKNGKSWPAGTKYVLSSNQQNIDEISLKVDEQVTLFKLQNPKLKNIIVDISIGTTSEGISDGTTVAKGLNGKYNTNAFIDKNFKPTNSFAPETAKYNYNIKIVVSGVE